jgi:hypothetical protein
MPDSMKPGKRSGRIIVALMAVAGLAAAIGTCSRFSADNPYSLRVHALNGRSVSAEFEPRAAARIEPRMMAVLSFVDSDLRREGRVSRVNKDADPVIVVVEFAGNLPSTAPARVSVDTSFPPEVLK